MCLKNCNSTKKPDIFVFEKELGHDCIIFEVFGLTSVSFLPVRLPWKRVSTLKNSNFFDYPYNLSFAGLVVLSANVNEDLFCTYWTLKHGRYTTHQIHLCHHGRIDSLTSEPSPMYCKRPWTWRVLELLQYFNIMLMIVFLLPLGFVPIWRTLFWNKSVRKHRILQFNQTPWGSRSWSVVFHDFNERLRV